MFKVIGVAADGWTTEEFVKDTVEEAVQKARILVVCMSNVKIIDDTDCIVFEFDKGKVVFPTKEDIATLKDGEIVSR